MHADLITDGDRQRTQVGSDPLDYVLRYAADDYDCYFQARYIGSRATLPKAIEVVRDEQKKAARHPLPSPVEDHTIAAYQDELHAIVVRLYDLDSRLAARPAESVLIGMQLTLARIRISEALRSLQDAERSLTLARRAAGLITALDTAA